MIRNDDDTEKKSFSGKADSKRQKALEIILPTVNNRKTIQNSKLYEMQRAAPCPSRAGTERTIPRPPPTSRVCLGFSYLHRQAPTTKHQLRTSSRPRCQRASVAATARARVLLPSLPPRQLSCFSPLISQSLRLVRSLRRIVFDVRARVYWSQWRSV